MMTKSAFHLSIKNTALGFESKDEYNEIMFLREITHTVNAFNDMALCLALRKSNIIPAMLPVPYYEIL